MFSDFSALPHSIPCVGNKYKTFKVNKTLLMNQQKQEKTKTEVCFL